MEISQAPLVGFCWVLSETIFNMSVWLSAKLSFCKICGTENDLDQGFERWSYFSRKFKFEGNRRVNETLRWEWSIVGLVRWEFVVQKLHVASAIRFQSCWSKNRGQHEFNNCHNFWKSDTCCNVGPTWAALPGARILTDAHPTKFQWPRGGHVIPYGSLRSILKE